MAGLREALTTPALAAHTHCGSLDGNGNGEGDEGEDEGEVEGVIGGSDGNATAHSRGSNEDKESIFRAITIPPPSIDDVIASRGDDERGDLG